MTWSFPVIDPTIATYTTGSSYEKLVIIASTFESVARYDMTVKVEYANFDTIHDDKAFYIEVLGTNPIVDISSLTTTAHLCNQNLNSAYPESTEIELCQKAAAFGYTCPPTDESE